MGGSKVKEWTPTTNITVVEWKKTYWTRKVAGKWIQRPKIRTIKSVPATPTKSPSKQPLQDMLYHGNDYIGDLAKQHFIPLQLPKSLGQNDYLQQWVPKTKQYLNILLEREMESTNVTAASHQRLPFHRISQWTGGFFEDSCLVKSGLVIWLGHNGHPCPWDDEVDDGFFTESHSDNKHTGDTQSHMLHPNQDDDSMDASDMGLDQQSTGMHCPKDADDLPTDILFIKNNKTITTIVDKSGVHTHMIKYCTCADAPSTDVQLFQMGMFPASFSQPKTAFTFEVLDNFLLDNLECGTSAMNYYSKLRRMTTSVFPHLVLDCYWELMRVARQWQKLKLLKWNGFGHENKDTKPGDLALFCPACPQPGIDVTMPIDDPAILEETNHESDLEMPSWLYSRSLVMDGNFKAEHLHAANPDDEVYLMDHHGEGEE
ncbi:hypothetical protein F4604DRAFT_1686888 [Suillus subluteus]|nr:hypothetical protein F4604DRAFT_1686888 [Suillus subluteus]